MDLKLEYLSAKEIGDLVNLRKITPSEVLSYFEKRIEEKNKNVNAFVYTKFEDAYKKAEEMEKELAKGKNLGPFAGVPFGLKDFLPSKIGWTNTHGGVKCLESVDSCNSTFCDAMEALGGIAIGKTNAPAYGFRGTTDNKMYGCTKTPFNTLYNSGGSSGGSAAAVSSGLCITSEGGDAGGSIRIPACFTNLYGFKSGLGCVPMVNRPDAWSATHPYCVNGGLTKTVEDTAILLKEMDKYNPYDPNSKPSNVNYVKEMKKSVKGMKIAYTYDFDLFDVEEEIKEKVDEAITYFEKLGVKCEPVHFHFKHSKKHMEETWCKAITVDCAIDIRLQKEMGNDLLKNHTSDFPEEFIYWKNICDKLGIMDLYDINLVRTDILDNFEDVFQNYDFIISPVSCVTGVLNKADNNTKGPEKINGHPVEPLIGWTETYLANFTSNPACSIPSGICKNGVPFGLQIIGKRFHEADVLALSYQYEKIRPWKNLYELSMK